MSEKRICKYCGVELPEDIPHGLRECHLYAVARIVELERQTRPIEDALNKRIAELEEKQRWIPVSEGLPEDLQSIIVFTKDRKTYIIRFLELYGREGFGSLSDIVTHWMPLPELPEGQE